MLAFLFFLILIAAIWQAFKRDEIAKDGIYLPAKVINAASTKGGYFATVEYKFLNRIFRERVRSQSGGEKVNHFYFVKVDPANPKNLIFLDNKPVPDCLLYVKTPAEGWKEMPECIAR